MKEIEFRVWDKEEKCFFYDFCIHSSGLISDSIGLLEKPKDPWQRIGKRYELMQYTGLHDKKGTKIFEGDIVEFPEHGYSRIIKWNDNDPGFSFGLSGCVFCKGNSKFMTIIGNVHQNPELLESIK